MIDLTQLREHPDTTIARIRQKDPQFDGEALYSLDKQMRTLTQEVEALRTQKNKLAVAARTGITPEIRATSKKIGTQLKEKEAALHLLANQFNDRYLATPNVPAADIPMGGKEENKIIKTVGTPPSFSFTPQHHLALGATLGWLDFETAAQLSAHNFALYKSDAVKMMYALPMLMLKNNIAHGYTPILPPVVVNEESLMIAGNFPKFKDDVYALENENLYLTPTAEVNFASMFRDTIFNQDDLPIRMTAWTSCFRREAGGYGAQERGLIRLHQFEKVELFTIATPEHADQELDKMVACAESILQKLGLHYRISLLASQDISFQAAKTYDIEVWLPGQKEYYEVSSISNCTDFQARRGLIRYRKSDTKKTSLVYTLNGSSLALPRLIVAIMETYQQEDGSIAIPDILKNEGIF